MSDDLAIMDLDAKERRKLIEVLPVEKRPIMSKALQALRRRIMASTKNYDEAFDANTLSLENDWYAGEQLRALKEQGLLSDGRPLKNGAPGHRFTLADVGVNRKYSERCQKLAAMDDETFRQWIADTYDPVKRAFPSLKAGAKRSDKERKTARLGKQYKAKIRKGDFRKVLADLEAIDAIITDPPYGKEALPLWADLAEFASDRLTENGMLIAYSGQMYLPQVLEALAAHLDYWWLMCVIHEGSGNLTPLGQPVRKVVNCWKPLVFFVRRGGSYEDTFRDRVPGELPDKDDHNWAQSTSEAAWLIESFTDAGSLVVDPFAGSGTIARAAEDKGRQFIGAELLDGQE